MDQGKLRKGEGSLEMGPPTGANVPDEEAGCCGCMASCCKEPTEEDIEQSKQFQAQRAAAITQAKQHANLNRPPEGLSMFAPAHVMGSHFGVGMGLYFRMLEWLMILFACTTFLAFPFWICINQSVFVNEEHKNSPGVGLKVFPEPSLLASTFASIPDRHIDPNNTLTFMLTELGSSWHGPMTKDDFLLWISLLDLVGTVLMICLITYFTYEAAKFEEKVDENTYDATDYAVQVVGLPPDAGVHEVGHFFSKFGEVMDVTIILSMARVLSACAKCATLEHKREQLLTLLSRVDASKANKALKQLEQTETDLAVALREIYNDMDRTKQKQHMMEQNFFSDPSCVDILLRPIVSTQNWWLAAKHEKRRKLAEQQEAVQLAEGSALNGDPSSALKVDEVGLEHPEKLGATAEAKTFTKKSVYDTKAAIVTFNRMSEADNCLKLTPNPGFRGWLYSHTVAQDAQCLRGYCIETTRACDPTDYQYENFSSSKLHRFCRRLGIYVLYLTMLIACGLIVSGLESRTRVEFNRESLDLLNDKVKVDIGEAGNYLPKNSPTGSTIFQLRSLYEEALRDAASSSTTPAYSDKLAEEATWDDYCRFALPEVCEDYYRNDLGGGQDADLRMTFGEHFHWSSEFQALVYERPLLTSLTKLANAADPKSVKGTDIGLSGCLACYCLGLSRTEEQLGQPTGDWLAISQHHCSPYYAGLNKDSGTAAGISVVIAVLNICLKLFVQFLCAHEGHTTRSATERSFCVVAYVLALLNTVLVILLVNARPNAKTTATGERVDEDDIQWLRYIILGGSFDDFSGRWYEYVGVSFIIVLFIQTIFPLLNVFIEVTISVLKRIFVYFSKNATQDDYDNAFDHPQFILQQRVADVMLNVSIAMLFSSGMPLCSGVVVLVFAIATLMDRWAVTNLMTVTRYGSQLPRLILGLLPWMVFLHCGFAIWQHSHFMLQNSDYLSTSVFIQLGMESEKENTARAETQFGQHIDQQNVNARISQPNSFGFLLLVFIMSIWIIYKFLIHGWLFQVIKLCLEGKQEEYKTSGDEAAARRAQSLERNFSKALDNPFQSLRLPGMEHLEPTAPDDEDEIYTFEHMVNNKKLKSTPTYRVPFQPRYAQTFSGLVNSEIWARMLGPDRYTRLVPVREEEPLCVYRVEVTTGNKWGAGTNSNVLLNIWGTKNGKLESTGLTNLASIRDNFERGSTDVFNLTLPDVGDVNEIEVRSCGKGFSAAWLLDKVTVADMQRGLTTVFPAYKWLDPKWPESLVVKLKAEPGMGHPRKAWPLDGGSDEGDGLHGHTDSGDGSRPGSARPGSKEGRGKHMQKLVRVRLGWRISPDIILRASDAPDLDANYEAEAEAEAAAERAKHIVPEARPANFYPAIGSAGGTVRYPRVGATGSSPTHTGPSSSGAAKYPDMQAPSTSAGGPAAVTATTGAPAPRYPTVTPAQHASSQPADGAALPTIAPAGSSMQAPGGGSSSSSAYPAYPTVPRAGQAHPSIEINPMPQGGDGGNRYPRVNPNQGLSPEFFWR